MGKDGNINFKVNREKLIKIFSKIITNVFVMSVVFGAGYIFGSTHESVLYKQLSAMCDACLKNGAKVKELLAENADKAADNIALKAELLLKEEIIGEFEEARQIETVISEIRDINATIFKEVDVKCEVSDKSCFKFLNEDHDLNPKIFGYLYDQNVKIDSTYFFSTINNQISIEYSDGKIDIQYGYNSFINPYRINEVTENRNLGAKIVDFCEKAPEYNEVDSIVNSVGYDMISVLEDLYIESVKEKFEDSEIPVYVNGKNLQEWDESCKKFSKVNTEGIKYQIVESSNASSDESSNASSGKAKSA